MTADPGFLQALDRHLSAIVRHDIDEFAATVAGDVRHAAWRVRYDQGTTTSG